MTTGKKLRRLRIEKRQTRRKAAENMGITKYALGKYEADARIPRDEVKIRMADYYQQPVQAIFFNE